MEFVTLLAEFTYSGVTKFIHPLEMQKKLPICRMSEMSDSRKILPVKKIADELLHRELEVCWEVMAKVHESDEKCKSGGISG